MSYRDYGFEKRYIPQEARVRRLLARLGVLALVTILTFIFYAWLFQADWLRP